MRRSKGRSKPILLHASYRHLGPSFVYGPELGEGIILDQGWAALLAAIVGLVGALGGAAAGGYAAIRGAREGAERSARAMQEQATQQAQDQFDHWLRLERRTIYIDVLQDADDVQGKLAELTMWRSGNLEDPAFVDALLAFDAAFRQLVRRSAPLVTVAHPAVVRAYQSVLDHCDHLCRTLDRDRSSGLPWEEILEQQAGLAPLTAELIGYVSVDTQLGPAHRTDRG